MDGTIVYSDVYEGQKNKKKNYPSKEKIILIISRKILPQEKFNLMIEENID